MAKWLLIYQKLELDTAHRPLGTHRLTLGHSTFWEAEEYFKQHSADPAMNQIAFIFNNANKRELTVPGIGAQRELVLIENDVFLRLNRREAKPSTPSTRSDKSYSFHDSFGKLIIVLQYVGNSIAYNYKASKILREYMLD